MPRKIDPDNPPIKPEDLETQALNLVRRRGRPVGANKEQVTIRLDRDVLAHLKKDGTGWQTRLNAALRRQLGLDSK